MLSAWNQDDRLALQGRLHRKQHDLTQDVGFIKGLQPLGLGSKRDGLFYVPQSYWPEQKVPLLLTFHDTPGSADEALQPLWDWIEHERFIVLAPDSRHANWDVLSGGFGPDVVFVDHALQFLFSHYNIDSSAIALMGSGAGGQYALALGMNNQNLFTHAIAYSQKPLAVSEKPNGLQLFVAQGKDRIIPPQVLRSALTWFLHREKG